MAVEVDRPETPTRAGGSHAEGGVGEVRMRAELSPLRFACQGGPLRAPPAELMAAVPSSTRFVRSLGRSGPGGGKTQGP
jgi:hypothetical protein